MRAAFRQSLAASLFLLGASPAAAQQQSTLPSAAVPAPMEMPAAGGAAALVNGQPIPESAVRRALESIPPAKQAEVRAEVITFLIENAIIDQFLAQLSIAIDAKEVDAKLGQFREALKKQGSSFDKALQELLMTEEELRTQIASQLRWEKYISMQATETALRELFDHNHDMFDGSMVRGRHILLSYSAGDAKAAEAARVRLVAVRSEIEAEVDRGLARMPATTDGAGRESARAKLIEEAFAAAASKESACPSRAQGGDLGYFPRSGSMVEPFARVAFALRPFQLSDVVTTQFGHHLILVTDRRAGKETKYEDVKEDVKEALGERLRDGLLARLRPLAKVVVLPVRP